MIAAVCESFVWDATSEILPMYMLLDKNRLP